MILRVASILASHRMGIVEPDESLTIRTVQRERIVNAMRFLEDTGTRVTTNLTQ